MTISRKIMGSNKFAPSYAGSLSKIDTITIGGSYRGIVVSADGKSVYVADYSSTSVFIFDRDITTGILTANGTISTGLGEITGICISADGTSVYVVKISGTGAAYSGLVLRFNRNTSTGALTANGFIIAGYNPTSVCISADGTSVYSTGFDNKVSIFSRNTSTGNLSGTSAIVSNTSAGNSYLAISADGTSVYLAADNSFTGKIVTFART